MPMVKPKEVEDLPPMELRKLAPFLQAVEDNVPNNIMMPKPKDIMGPKPEDMGPKSDDMHPKSFDFHH